MSQHLKFIDEKIRLISREKAVLDVGGGEPFQKWLLPYKKLFASCDYKTFDSDSKSGADIIGDIHQIPLGDAAVDAIVCHSVLEHIESPAKAVWEMQRILKPGGKIFLYVPSIYPYHARPGVYPDHWRFFEDTLRYLFRDFQAVEIVKRGGYFTALSFFFPYQHKLRWLLDPLASLLDWLFVTDRRTTTAGYYLFAHK